MSKPKDHRLSLQDSLALALHRLTPDERLEVIAIAYELAVDSEYLRRSRLRLATSEGPDE